MVVCIIILIYFTPPCALQTLLHPRGWVREFESRACRNVGHIGVTVLFCVRACEWGAMMLRDHFLLPFFVVRSFVWRYINQAKEFIFLTVVLKVIDLLSDVHFVPGSLLVWWLFFSFLSLSLSLLLEFLGV